MSNTLKDKIIERIQQLLDKADKVKETHKPNPPNVGGLPTLDEVAFFEWKSGVENLITMVAGENSPYYRNFLEHVKSGYRRQLDSGVGILRAFKEDLELGFLSRIKDLVLAEVFTDFLDIAQHLLENGYKDPAASLAGAVLEDGLRKIAEKNNIKIKNNDNIDSLDTKLFNAKIYGRLAQKKIQTWKEIRNSADHGKFNEYKSDDVKDMIEDIRQFLSENLQLKNMK